MFVFIYQWRKKWRFSHPGPSGLRLLSSSRAAATALKPSSGEAHSTTVPGLLCRNMCFSQLLPCLSRACVGKNISFSIKWRQKHVSLPEPRWCQRGPCNCSCYTICQHRAPDRTPRRTARASIGYRPPPPSAACKKKVLVF